MSYDNKVETATLIKNEGLYPTVSKYYTSQLDNFTDSIMFLESIDETEDSIVNRALLIYRDGNEDLSSETVEDVVYDNFEGKNTYARYWHGFLSTLKPTLSLFGYKNMRIINFVIQTLLTIFVCFKLFKINKNLILPFLLSVFMIEPNVIGQSLQFSTCYYLMLLSSIAILCNQKKDRYNYIFVIIGCFTSYFDLLTYPLVTLGVPLIFYLIINEDTNIKKSIITIMEFSILWMLGYGLMWTNKWILASILTNQNVIFDALKVVGERVSTNGFSFIDAVVYNLYYFLKNPIIIFVILYVIHKIIELSRKRRFSKILLPYAIIALYPIIWYMCTVNHSCIHAWFTNKLLIVSCMSILVGVCVNAEN